MAERRFLFRSCAGIDHYIITDDDGSNRFEAVGDTDAVIERNKILRNANDGYSQSRELARIATVPEVLILKWLNEEGWWFYDAGHDPDVAKKLWQKLNDVEYQHLRTSDVRIGISNGELF